MTSHEFVSSTTHLSVIAPMKVRLSYKELSFLFTIAFVLANGIPIEGWTHDPSDEALLDLLPVLDSLRFTSDVRRVLGIRGFS
jgi:TFIIF-interacting CTD phosphatase-like protein